MKYFDRPAAWFVLIAVAFELALGAIAFAGGQFWRHWPLVGLGESTSPDSMLVAVGWGMLATSPLTLGLALVTESRWRPLVELSDQAERLLKPLLAGVRPIELLFVALAAGIGEELLFRGLLQAGLAQWWSGHWAGWLAAWLLTSLVFGVCHWISGMYAILAFLAGFYLGGLLLVFDNLLVPITAHAMYDLAALIYLANRMRDVRDEW
ncbi:MAG TPA: CPBP family intramembrane glutamic endopeptidase [Pirellulaceae bacterium]|nr:CPBP family intramembrane glutamic endopeptidase [Pirellulaceae bacterium]